MCVGSVLSASGAPRRAVVFPASVRSKRCAQGRIVEDESPTCFLQTVVGKERRFEIAATRASTVETPAGYSLCSTSSPQDSPLLTHALLHRTQHFVCVGWVNSKRV